MTLSPCRAHFGQARYIERDPGHIIARDVVFTGTGLYDYRRKMVSGSGEYRGVPYLHLAPGGDHQPFVTTIDPKHVTDEAPDDLYYWGGILKGHYGHFLVNTIARLWLYADLPRPRPKILHWWKDVRVFWELPYVRALFEQLDIGLDDFARFERPTRIRNIIVPESSFEENHLVHEAYGRLMRSIGDGLAPGPASPSSAPLYLSRSRVDNGTSCITNEAVFEDRLRRGGFTVFHPEQHAVDAQIAALRERELVAGFIGSALLNLAFTERKKVIGVSYDAGVYSNQVLTDLVADNRALYLYPQDDLIPLEPTAKFQLNYRLADPVRTAEELLRAVDGFEQGQPRTRRTQLETLSLEGFGDEPLGVNISLGRSLECEPATTAESGGSHHRWRVDLGRRCELHEVRVHVAAARAESPMMFVFLDAQATGEAGATRASSGDPGRSVYRWLPDRPRQAQTVRIEFSETNRPEMEILALEVFGQAMTSPEASA